ncbi:IS66 family transposase [Thiohalorhabdus methylotrophus]|uniref:IS66 family transposase n=1 Tax=Thiohalorhabdus methylotrophus TaxID=3242694 RepID=A0ABV4U2B3_9GAMM
MATEPETLPDDPEQLKALVRSYKAETERLQEMLNILRAKQFGPTSEKAVDQYALFDEAEVETAEEGPSEAVEVPGHTRTKRGRKPLPDNLPREEIVHDLPDEDKVCAEDGAALERIGEEVAEQLDVIPAKVQVLRHVRPKYACPCCEDTGVHTPAMPPQPIPGSIASPGLLAHVATAKYVDGLPLYRMATILERAGVDLPRATLAHWMVRMGEAVQPLVNLLGDALEAGPVLQMDETPVQVLKERGKKATSQSYMWIQKGGPPGKPAIRFRYAPTRGHEVPKRLLADFHGYLQTDGYSAYGTALAGRDDVVAVGCWAHARRPFDEAIKAHGKKKAKKAGHARQGLDYIQQLYAIERQARDQGLDAAARYRLRQDQAKPLLDEMRAWLDEALTAVPPKSATGKALHYLAGQWERLVRYLGDGRIPIDNNGAENAIRPFVLGRKNWLFSNSIAGATASANLYSLVETAKANGHEPYAYLRHLFKELPATDSAEAYEALLPWNLDPKTLQSAPQAAIDG